MAAKIHIYFLAGTYDSSPSVESSIRTSLMSITEPAGLRAPFTRIKDTVGISVHNPGDCLAMIRTGRQLGVPSLRDR